MLVLYEPDYKNVAAVFTGYHTSLDIVKKHTPAFANYKGVMLNDNSQVIQNLDKYRVVEQIIGQSRCELKPLAQLSLSKPQITAGVDSAVLTISLSELQPEDDITNIDLYFNDALLNQSITNNALEIPISSVTPGIIETKVNSKLFRFNPVSLEVV